MDQIPPDKPQRVQHPLEAPPPAPIPQPQRTMVRIVGPDSPPVAMYTIIALNVVIFMVDMISHYALTNAGAKVNELILFQYQFWRLITPIFLHAGFIHLGLNCYSLYLFGRQIERSFGTWRFLSVYMLSGIAGVVASLAFSPGASIGASGAVFGLIGSMIPFLYHNRTVLANPQSAINQIIGLIVFNLGFGLLNNLLAGQGTGVLIDNWGHIGGLATGLAMAWFISPRLMPTALVSDIIRLNDTSSSRIAFAVSLITSLVLMTAVAVIVLINRVSL